MIPKNSTSISRLLLIVLIMNVAGCGRSTEPLPDRADYPNLQDVLFELATTRNPADFARRNDLHYEKGQVRVIIELTSVETEVPSGYDVVVELRSKDRPVVQALVPIKQLLPLAKDPKVVYVRAPLKPQPD